MKDGTVKIFVLTWHEKKVLVFKEIETGDQIEGKPRVTLEYLEELQIPKSVRQGWGLAAGQCINSDDKMCKHLYITDGSDFIDVYDAETWKYVKSIEVRNKAKVGTLHDINELEIVTASAGNTAVHDSLHFYIFAHCFNSESLFMIDLRTGSVVAEWDMQALADR